MIKRRIKCCKCGKRETTLVSEQVKRGRALCLDCELKERRKAQAEEARRRAESFRRLTTNVWWD